jgi:predicted GNAT family acetyltransferase
LKSPWKYLADLTGLEKRAGDRQGDNGDDGMVDRESHPARVACSKQASSDVSDADRIERGSHPVEGAMAGVREDSGQTAIPSPDQIVPAEAVRHGVANDLIAKACAEARRAQSRTRQGLKATASFELVNDAVPAREAAQPQAPAEIGSFVQKMAMLDEEIMDLRRQLSQKLHKQNIQQAMLDRFNQS